jgi:hypothetical protein
VLVGGNGEAGVSDGVKTAQEVNKRHKQAQGINLINIFPSCFTSRIWHQKVSREKV